MILLMQANVLISPFLPQTPCRTRHCVYKQQIVVNSRPSVLTVKKKKRVQKMANRNTQENTESSCFDCLGILYDCTICLVTFPYLISVFITAGGSPLAALEATADVQAVQNDLIVCLNDDVASRHFECAQPRARSFRNRLYTQSVEASQFCMLTRRGSTEFIVCQ